MTKTGLLSVPDAAPEPEMEARKQLPFVCASPRNALSPTRQKRSEKFSSFYIFASAPILTRRVPETRLPLSPCLPIRQCSCTSVHRCIFERVRSRAPALGVGSNGSKRVRAVGTPGSISLETRGSDRPSSLACLVNSDDVDAVDRRSRRIKTASFIRADYVCPHSGRSLETREGCPLLHAPRTRVLHEKRATP